MAKKEYDSCVMKRDWAHYKTCNECPQKKTCAEKWSWWQRAIETVMVWNYLRKIGKKLKRMFGGTKLSKRDIRYMRRQSKYPKLNSNKKLQK